jgi:transposase
MAHKAARSRARYVTVKGRDGMVESLQVLTRARASALKARKAVIEQIRSLIVSASDPALAARIALEALSGRYQDLDAAIGAILEEKCIGSQGTVQLMISVGDNLERLKQRVVVLLCGVAACPASSGLTTLYRLNRGAFRAANSAIHIAAPGRLRTDDRTRA